MIWFYFICYYNLLTSSNISFMFHSCFIRDSSLNTFYTIKTIVGTGTASYSGDGGDATSATLNSPFGVSLDSSGIQYDFLIAII